MRALPDLFWEEPVKAARGARSSEDRRKTAARAREATPPYRRKVCVAEEVDDLPIPAWELGLLGTLRCRARVEGRLRLAERRLRGKAVMVLLGCSCLFAEKMERYPGTNRSFRSSTS